MQVFTKESEQIYIVSPDRYIANGIAVSKADTDRCPIVVYIFSGIIGEVSEEFCLSCFEQGFGFAVAYQKAKHIKGRKVKEPLVISASLYFGNKFLTGINFCRGYIIQ